MPESREAIEARKKVVKQDLEIFGNSYWYDGERLDPTKFTMFINRKAKPIVSPAWDKWMENARMKKVCVVLIGEPKTVPHLVSSLDGAPILKDFDSEVIVLDYPSGDTQVIRRQFIESMNSYKEKKDGEGSGIGEVRDHR